MGKKIKPTQSSVSLLELRLAQKLTMGSTRLRMKEISDEEMQRRLVLPKRKSRVMINIEIKAICSEPNRIREILKSRDARFAGLDHQIDTYFKTKIGRLKLREGNIENALIYYEREDQQGPKKSDVILYKAPGLALKEILSKSLGILVIVNKQREIYFIDNVKFHIDTVQDLGTFVEIEAIDEEGTIGQEQLLKQCGYYLSLFEISDEHLIARSYSDLLLKHVLESSKNIGP
jgi:adenylate cyclase, class 2